MSDKHPPERTQAASMVMEAILREGVKQQKLRELLRGAERKEAATKIAAELRRELRDDIAAYEERVDMAFDYANALHHKLPKEQQNDPELSPLKIFKALNGSKAADGSKDFEAWLERSGVDTKKLEKDLELVPGHLHGMESRGKVLDDLIDTVLKKFHPELYDYKTEWKGEEKITTDTLEPKDRQLDWLIRGKVRERPQTLGERKCIDVSCIEPPRSDRATAALPRKPTHGTHAV